MAFGRVGKRGKGKECGMKGAVRRDVEVMSAQLKRAAGSGTGLKREGLGKLEREGKRSTLCEQD